MRIRRPRVAMDVSELPDICFGPRDIMWWGTAGFVVIEGFTMVLCWVVLVYLHQNFPTWPPEDTKRPALGLATFLMALMLLSVPFLRWIEQAAKRYDLAAMRRWLPVAGLLSLAFVGLRIAELATSVNVKWNTNAYGSAVWLVLGAHGTLLLVEAGEMVGFALMFWLAPIEEKHFSDVADAGFYWYFMVAAGFVSYVLVFLLPRWI
jgi:Heme/copper-type cytochrome/quinol oxidase, subunit 3